MGFLKKIGRKIMGGGGNKRTVEMGEDESVSFEAEASDIGSSKPEEMDATSSASVEPLPKKEEPKVGIPDRTFRQVASNLNVEPAKIQAVDEVESRGQGFLRDGRPKILFEAHWFSRFTDGKYNASHPNISSASWDRSLYEGGMAEHDRIQKAMELDREAALKSASWGRYQIMGFNWKMCGYKNLQSFIDGMWESESEHLRAFVGFVYAKDLVTPLRRGDWRAFAKGYNGPQYEKNNYHIKMKEAYERYKNQA